MKKEEKDVVYNHLLNVNDPKYSLQKTVEELLELALILSQRINKSPELVLDSHIIEEIGDVKIRLKVLEQMFPEELIKNRVNFKLKKFYKYIIEKTYKNI